MADATPLYLSLVLPVPPVSMDPPELALTLLNSSPYSTVVISAPYPYSHTCQSIYSCNSSPSN